MGYYSRHFRKVARRVAAAGLVATAPAVAVPPKVLPLIIDEVPPEPAWTVTAPNRPPLVVQADSETAARKAARASWGLSRLPNGATVSPA